MKMNAIVGQSGGPTSVINASLTGVFQACQMRGAEHVYGMLNGIQGLLEERVCDLSARLTSFLDIELLSGRIEHGQGRRIAPAHRREVLLDGKMGCDGDGADPHMRLDTVGDAESSLPQHLLYLIVTVAAGEFVAQRQRLFKCLVCSHIDV